MSNRRLKRIMNEIKDLEESAIILEQNGIYIYYDESNIDLIYALLVGPEGTPYEKGFYFFRFEYPKSYPMQPPIAKYYTQGTLLNPISKKYQNIRFNPNLYTCGKVCLSMLNTWSGPGWVPTNTISNVLVAIQALVLNDFPLRNEPGFENACIKELQKYNDVISYSNIDISVFGMLKNIPSEFIFFKPKIEELFLRNLEYYRNYLLTNISKIGNDTLIESPAYSMKVILDYESLLYKCDSVENEILTNQVEGMKLG